MPFALISRPILSCRSRDFEFWEEVDVPRSGNLFFDLVWIVAIGFQRAHKLLDWLVGMDLRVPAENFGRSGA
jgi:hypothetical protein